MRKLFVLMVVVLLGLFQPVLGYNRESAIGASVGTLLIWNPMKLDGVGLDYGTDEGFERARMLWLWRYKNQKILLNHISLSGHSEFAFGQVQPTPQNVNIGITPVLEWSLSHLNNGFVLETGLGASFISRKEHVERDLTTHFQFSEILGIAFRYNKIQLGLRFQHISNADIEKPNNGYNFYGAVLKYWY